MLTAEVELLELAVDDSAYMLRTAYILLNWFPILPSRSLLTLLFDT